MKKIVAVIFVCTAMSFTACGDKASTLEPSSAVEAKATEESMENTTENITDVEMDDEEYLINLGKQLRRGMTEEEVIEKIGEPDERMGSGVYWLRYCRGECRLSVDISQEDEVYGVHIYNSETSNYTEIVLPYT